jgi:hypothetical protein
MSDAFEIYELGQAVRRKNDSEGPLGCIIAFILMEPRRALVRWPGARSTFETLDSLEPVAQELV